jgi:hypothetical protein
MKIANRLLIAVALSIGFCFLLIPWGYIMNIVLAESEVHLIPAGYRGSVVILYDRPNAEPTLYENGNRVYTIPSSGTLFTQFHPPSSSDGSTYFYVYEDGKREELSVVRSKDEMVDSNKVYVFMRHDYGSGSIPETRKNYTTYVVGTAKDDEQE